MKAVMFDKKESKLLSSTDDALKWFPELEKFFEHFDIKHMSIRLNDVRFGLYGVKEDKVFKIIPEDE